MRLQVKKNPHVCGECPRFEGRQCLPSNIPHEGVDVLFVSDQPGTFSASNNEPFIDHGGRIIKTAVRMFKDQDRYKQIGFRYAYAVRCAPEEEGDKPNKAVMTKCQPLLMTTIKTAPPKVIVALGAKAAKQLGFKEKHKDMRGKLLRNGQLGDIPVMVTFGERALLGNPGLFSAFKLDLKNAFDYVLSGEKGKRTLEDLTKEYRLPYTVDDALEVCEEIYRYCRAGKAPNEWPIAVDTETTSLHPELQTSRIIAFCFAWDPGKSATIIYDHPHAPPEYLERLPEIHAAIDKILRSDKPKIYHNAKFDLKFTDHRYGFKTNNVVWDSMCGEHLIDEDKKGNYGLKALTAGWLPDYCGYEDKLWDFLKEEEDRHQAELIDEEIDHLKKVISDKHSYYIDELEQYKVDFYEYEEAFAKWELDMLRYEGELEGYYRARVGLKYLVDGWHKELEQYARDREEWGQLDKETRGERPKKPLKPKKWHSRRPKKPSKPKEPKKPKDPRSKKERKVFSDAGFEKVPIKDLQLYGAVDTDVTRQISVIQLKRIMKEDSKVKPLMRSHIIPATHVLGKMEYRGTKIDYEYLDYLEVELKKVVHRLEDEIYRMATPLKAKEGDLNLHGPDLGNVLYNWGWVHPDGTEMPTYEATETTASGLPSRAERVLRQYVEYEDDDKEVPTKEAYFVERWLTYAKAHKALNTFVGNIRVLSKRTGRLHTSFHINGTGTGRLSSSDMNLQNIPKFLAKHNIKKLFVPSNDDLVFVNADYSGAEVRVFTAYARDQKLIEALNDGLNMHSFFASKVFGEPYEDYENRENPVALPDPAYRKKLDKQRQNIKRVVFGILYGAGPYKIAESINVDLPTAKELIAMLFEMFPAINEYIRQIDYEVDRNGWVETLFGRRRRFPLARMRRHRGRATRQARNFKIQSTSSDIVMSQLIEINEQLQYHFDQKAEVLLTVHDSICMEFPKKYVHQLKDFLYEYGEKRVSEKYPWLPVPFQMDVECGPSYGECMPVDQYIKKHPFKARHEGVIEEQEILNELRDAPYEGAA